MQANILTKHYKDIIQNYKKASRRLLIIIIKINYNYIIKKQVGDSEIDVFTISETWLTQAIPNSLVDLDKYSTARLDRSWGGDKNGFAKRGGGLLSLIGSPHGA